MRAMYYDGTGGLQWRDDPEPALEQDTDAIVRPIAASTCDLDQAIIGRRIPGYEQPFAIGHEAVGEVIEVGPAVRSVAAGELVSICHHLSCGDCDRCATGHPEHCRTTTANGPAVFGMPVGTNYGGLFAESVRVPFADYTLIGLPPGVSALDAVSVGDNLTDAWRLVVPHLRDRPGADVLIMSTGSCGLYAADIARAYGARRVRYIDRDESRLALAEQFGAETGTLAEFSPEERQYDVTLNAAGPKTALQNAILATAPGGHCENMAFFFQPVELPLFAMHLKCINFRSSVANSRVHMAEVMQLLTSGRIDPDLVRTSVHPLESAVSVIDSAGFKPVFTQELSGAA